MCQEGKGEGFQLELTLFIGHLFCSFLDEPTSGLDSTSACSVVGKVKDIARGGSIVLMTIHQPSHRIQLLLDRITVLINKVLSVSELVL